MTQDISLPYSPTCTFNNDQSLGKWLSGLFLFLLEFIAY